MQRFRHVSAAVAFVLCAAGHASGSERGTATELERARAAYERGVRANAASDHLSAARAFAEADAISPQAASLEAALESSMKADDAALGAELLARAEGRSPDAGLRKTLESARTQFRGRTGRLQLVCGGEGACLFSVDGVAVVARREVYVAVGPHAVVAQRANQRVERLVDVRAESVVTVGAEPPPSVPRAVSVTALRTPATAEPSRFTVPRGWVYVGIGATALVGAASLWSGGDTLRLHSQFVTHGCTGAGTSPADCVDRANDGERAQLRTNVLIVATAATALTTAALALFFVRWRSDSNAHLSLAASRSVGLATVQFGWP